MKKMALILFVALLPLLFHSCNKLDKFTIFEINYTEQFVIESAIGINLPFNLNTPEITTNSESSFEINDTRKDMVEEITVKNATLTLISPSNSDLSFLNDINIYIKAEGLDEKLVGYKHDIPNSTGITLALDLSSDDFQEYIKKDKIILSDHTISLDVDFEVNAKILGI